MPAFIQTAPTRRFAAPGVTSTRLPVANLNNHLASCRVFNDTNQIIGVAFGDSTVVANLTDNTGLTVPVPVGALEALRMPAGVTHVAVIAAAASTGDVFVTPGDGD
jgi:hypothetical protein